MEPVIGLDFGNFNSFTCFIEGFDEGTRMGGHVHDLLPARLEEGIPSVYFYSGRTGRVLLGENAVRASAVPLQNRLRYLKRHLGETTVLDGKTISYDQAVTEVVQHCVRSANEQLRQGWLTNTNLVSLAYPATYTCAQRQRLVELVERATLEDGTKVKVFGTIAEPAAAALDYLAEFARSDRDTTVLVYDLGGGTFDLGLVSVYPRGRKNGKGHTYYYDIVNTRGISKLGGAEFDEVMFRLMSDKIKVPLNRVAAGMLRDLAETTKILLSTQTEETAQLLTGDDYIDIPITRREFEAAARELLMKTVEETRKILQDHPNQMPEMILLTGGASQMPMVKNALEEALPQYREKIAIYRPSRAIAYGAARFGTVEQGIDPSIEMIQKRVPYDLGVRYYHQNSEKRYIHVFIKAGTELPCTSPVVDSTTRRKTRASSFLLFEANKENPDVENFDNDFTAIMSVEVDYGRTVPAGHPNEAQLHVDKMGLLTIEARDASIPDLPWRKASVQLKNLS